MRQAGTSQIAALHLSATLHALAEVNPNFAEILETAAIDIQQRGQTNATKERETVLYAIRKRQCWTVRELIEETGLSSRRIRRALQWLIAARHIYPLRAPASPQRGGIRNLQYYLPAEQQFAATAGKPLTKAKPEKAKIKP